MKTVPISGGGPSHQSSLVAWNSRFLEVGRAGKRYRSRGALVTCAMVMTILLHGGAARSFESDFKPKSFPVPITIEGERVRSSLFIQFEMKAYGEAFDGWARHPLDAVETAFETFTRSLQAGDVSKVAAMRPGEDRARTASLVDTVRRAFGGLENVSVVSQVLSGRRNVFVWEWSREQPLRRGFAFEEMPDQGYRVDLVTSNLPVETVILDLLQEQVMNPRAYSAATPATRYACALPLATRADAGHPVTLLFDGEVVDVDVMAPEPGTQPSGSAVAAVLDAYRSAYRALKTRDLDRFLDSYTDASRKKLTDWLKAMRPEQFAAFHGDATARRQVWFVLDADPVYLVFVAGSDGRLQHEYMIRTAKGYKLTNAYFATLLDDVIGNAKFFPKDVGSFERFIIDTNPR
jgi:hypothetical protein